jgi:hypothetical protein
MDPNARHVYLDTNAFRYFGEAFANDRLADDLRQKMLVSPLSTFEVLAQLARQDCGDDVLRQINAIRNWTDPSRAGLLPWPDAWLYQVWFQEQKPDDGFAKRMENALNWCMTADSPASLTALREASAEHGKLIDDFKLEKANEFRAMIEAAKQENVKAFDMSEAWFASIANSVGADPKSKPVAEIVSALSAHHEFEQAKLKTALANPEYNPLSRKNQNDIIDAEQLVYLADESLYMLTADSGFKSKVTKSKQAARIITAAAIDLIDSKKIEVILRAALTSGPL